MITFWMFYSVVETGVFEMIYCSSCDLTGEDIKTVQKEVAQILEGRILVGHAIHNDLKVQYTQNGPVSRSHRSWSVCFFCGKQVPRKHQTRLYYGIRDWNGLRATNDDIFRWCIPLTNCQISFKYHFCHIHRFCCWIIPRKWSETHRNTNHLGRE